MLTVETHVDLNSQTARVNRALGTAIAFMTLVAVIDLIARRNQQLLLALSIGLAAVATWEAASQVAFIQSYAYYKSTQAKPGGQPPAPVR